MNTKPCQGGHSDFIMTYKKTEKIVFPLKFVFKGEEKEMTIQSVNPFNRKIIRNYEELSSDATSKAVEETHRAHLEWKRTDFSRRASLMKKAADGLRKGKDIYAALITEEMGKPITQARGEIEKCAWVCDYYADHTQAILAPEMVETEAKKSYVVFNPLGVILAVMPWNFPLWQVFRFAAPALMAGNGGVLKHASNVPGSALAIEEVFERAGFPSSSL